MLSRLSSRAVRSLSQTSYGAARALSSVVFSERLQKEGRTDPTKLMNTIDLLVCDMAGTTVEEGGLVYEVLRKSMLEAGLDVSEEAMHPWHGAKKEAVIEHFLIEINTPGPLISRLVTSIGEDFLRMIDEAYFAQDSVVKYIDPTLPQYIRDLQAQGTKVGLDTGYPREIQDGLMTKLELHGLVDASVSSYEVLAGRPYPYMIFDLMTKLQVMDVRRVAKAGDSVRDMEEGCNAGCGLVIGVLSGADTAEQLLAAGADVIVPNITHVPIPSTGTRGEVDSPLIDLS